MRRRGTRQVASTESRVGVDARRRADDWNVFARLKISVPEQPQRTASEEEIEAMLNHARGNRRDRALLTTLVDTGARRGELAHADYADVDLTSGTTVAGPMATGNRFCTFHDITVDLATLHLRAYRLNYAEDVRRRASVPCPTSGGCSASTTALLVSPYAAEMLFILALAAATTVPPPTDPVPQAEVDLAAQAFGAEYLAHIEANNPVSALGGLLHVACTSQYVTSEEETAIQSYCFANAGPDVGTGIVGSGIVIHDATGIYVLQGLSMRRSTTRRGGTSST